MPRGRTPGNTTGKENLTTNWDTAKRGQPSGAMTAGEPGMPEGLPSEATEVWERVVYALSEAGVLTESDAPLVKRYCLLAVEIDKLWDMILNADTPQERADLHSTLSKVTSHFERAERALGLSPASRKSMRIGIAPAKDGNAGAGDDGDEIDFFAKWG